MIYLKKFDSILWVISFKKKKKKYVFVNNKRTVKARNFFIENIGISILFRMIPIRLKYLNPIIEKKQK